MSKNNDYCIILAGGLGRRLWPASRTERPKQFLDIFGTGRTLLQQTFDRFVRVVPADRIIVSTFQGYVKWVREQLPDLPEGNILAEPVQLSTAPAVAWATYHIHMRDPQANVVVSPADQWIAREDRFAEQLREGFDYVEQHAEILALGVPATVPNTAYGYIQTGDARSTEGLYGVKSFSEKPEQAYAELFVQSGEFVWNTGLFQWHMPTMMALLAQVMPLVAQRFDAAQRNLTTGEEVLLVREYYPSALHRSIDLVILDKCENVSVKVCDFGWADVGSWQQVYDVAGKDVDSNVVLPPGRALLYGCRGNVVSLPEGMAAVVRGLEGYLVAVEGNVLVVCPKDDATAARRTVNDVQVQLGEEYL